MKKLKSSIDALHRTAQHSTAPHGTARHGTAPMGRNLQRETIAGKLQEKEIPTQTRGHH